MKHIVAGLFSHRCYHVSTCNILLMYDIWGVVIDDGCLYGVFHNTPPFEGSLVGVEIWNDDHLDILVPGENVEIDAWSACDNLLKTREKQSLGPGGVDSGEDDDPGRRRCETTNISVWFPVCV